MKRFLSTCLAVLTCYTMVNAQQVHKGSATFHGERTVVNMAQEDDDWEFVLRTETSKHGRLLDKRKAGLDASRDWSEQRALGQASFKKGGINPEMKRAFNGPFPTGVPNDNNIAISNDGIIVAVINSNIRMFDSDGKTLAVRPLSAIAKDVGQLDRTFDPHVLYDHEEDRFIMIFLNGSNSDNTNLLVGFSQSNDPTKNWNFYKLPGNVYNDNTWSDYPFMAINKQELFIPVLLWFNGESGWDSEAQELIWQIDKMQGYAGEELDYKYYDSIMVSNRQVWNTRPVGGSKSHYGPNMYFVANRGIDVENDSFFLFEITNTLASGKAELKTKVAKTDLPYGIPPSAHQTKEDDPLRTNYADVHGAFYHAGAIHFAGNSRAKSTNSPGIYYGVMTGLNSDNPKVKGKILSSDTLDMNYPNIAYAGGFGPDRTCIINFLHASANTHPGSSVVIVDRDGDFSDIIRVKEGEGHVNQMSSDIERWGDYTGIQRKYNEDGVVWMAGSYGTVNNRQATWIAEIKNTDPALNLEKPRITSVGLFPNPALETINLKFKNPEDQVLQYELYAADGRLVKEFGSFETGQGVTQVSFNIQDLSKGAYSLRVSAANGSPLATLSVLKQ